MKGTTKFFKPQCIEIKKIEDKTIVMLEENQIVLEEWSNITDLDTLEKNRKKEYAIRRNHRKYLINKGIIDIQEGQKVMFCSSEADDPTIKSSTFIVLCLIKHKNGELKAANIVNYYDKSIYHTEVGIEFLEPI